MENKTLFDRKVERNSRMRNNKAAAANYKNTHDAIKKIGRLVK